MNHSYRLVWSDLQTAYVPVPEFARRRGQGSGVKALSAALIASLALTAHALPQGGQVAAGQGKIAQNGAAMTVTQQSQNLSINWQSFGIGANESVSFAQPNASSIALNRVLGTDPSAILGRLSANGQVWILNPNGVLFGAGAQVNVGGLLASTLQISDADFLAGKRTFTGKGGTVTNLGTLTAADGGYIALLGGKVSNEGVIQARLGTVALGAGKRISLDFAGDKLLSLQVEQGAVDALAQNKQLIRADGGTVLMSARAADALIHTVVNNQGTIEARSIDTRSGTIKLLGSGGTLQVAGTLDASAPNGGDGGFIETSGDRVKVAAGTTITTAAPAGRTGTWLVDPHDFTVAASGGDITGTTLGTTLDHNNVILRSSAGSTLGSGDVNINDAVTWHSNHRLTLTASNDVNVNASLTATGAKAGIAINPNTANGGEKASGTGVFKLGPGAAINLPNVSPTSKTALVIGGTPYTVINSLGMPGSTTGTDLQGINGRLAGHYALGSDIDASATAGWNGGVGFTPIGNASTAFTGVFDGLGHSVSGLTIDRVTAPDRTNVGLFGVVGKGGTIRNTGVIGGLIRGLDSVGALVGRNEGTVTDSYSISYNSGDVTGFSSVGGLVGYNLGTVANSYHTGPVGGRLIGTGTTGGLVGRNDGSISNSYSSGAVEGWSSIGGLVGDNRGTVTNSYSTGDVHGEVWLGGLAGINSGSISNSFSTGTVNGQAVVGGLVGANSGSVSQSYSTGAVLGMSAGGLVGDNYGAISDSYSTGAVCCLGAGGLVGENYGTIRNSYSTGPVSYENGASGGLVAFNQGTVISSYWDVNTSGQSTSAGGTGLTSEQMRMQSSFVGWDFVNIWYLPPNSTPILLNSPYVLKVAANDASRIYGHANPAFTATYSNFWGSDTAGIVSGLNLSSSAAASSPVGTYAITGSGASATSGTGRAYTIAYVPGTLTVEARPVTLTGTRTYDGTTAVGGSILSVSNVVGNDTVSLTGTGTLAGKNAGTSAITGFGSLALNNPNYTLTGGSGWVNITPKPLTATIVGDPTKVYDGTTTAKLKSDNYSLDGVVSGESVRLAKAPHHGTYNSKNVSEATTVTASLNNAAFKPGAGTLLSNYLLPTSASGSGHITPATLVYKADAVKMTQGKAIPTLTGTVTGFVKGETLASATTGTALWQTLATSSSPAGHYAIDGSGLTADYGNYLFIQAPKNASALTIRPCKPGKATTCS